MMAFLHNLPEHAVLLDYFADAPRPRVRYLNITKF